MTANPLKGSYAPDRPIPPKDPEERRNFWIARGNALLEEAGKHHLHWAWSNGNYYIEERPRSRPQLVRQ